MLTLSGPLGLPNPNLLAAGVGPIATTFVQPGTTPPAVATAINQPQAGVITPEQAAAANQAMMTGQPAPTLTTNSSGTIVGESGITTQGTYICSDGSTTTDPTLASCPTAIFGVDLSTIFWVALVVGGGWFLWKKYQAGQGTDDGVPLLAP